MAKTERLSLRLTKETIRQAKELGRLWCCVAPLSSGKVVEECVRYMHEREVKIQKNRR